MWAPCTHTHIRLHHPLFATLLPITVPLLCSIICNTSLYSVELMRRQVEPVMSHLPCHEYKTMHWSPFLLKTTYCMPPHMYQPEQHDAQSFNKLTVQACALLLLHVVGQSRDFPACVSMVNPESVKAVCASVSVFAGIRDLVAVFETYLQVFRRFPFLIF